MRDTMAAHTMRNEIHLEKTGELKFARAKFAEVGVVCLMKNRTMWEIAAQELDGRSAAPAMKQQSAALERMTRTRVARGGWRTKTRKVGREGCQCAIGPENGDTSYTPLHVYFLPWLRHRGYIWLASSLPSNSCRAMLVSATKQDRIWVEGVLSLYRGWYSLFENPL